jgi:hypothetical protein
MIKKENIIYGIILKFSEETLKEVIPFFKEDLKGLKRIRETKIF